MGLSCVQEWVLSLDHSAHLQDSFQTLSIATHNIQVLQLTQWIYIYNQIIMSIFFQNS